MLGLKLQTTSILISGYTVSDFESIIPVLNSFLHQKPREANKTVRNKYAHKIFFEVSKIPLMTTEKLLEKDGQCSHLCVKLEKEEVSHA